ncbi:L-lactate dehydrogenase P [compost metagenome]
MLNVSTLLTDYNGVSDVYLGVPCVVDHNGVREILDLPLNDVEKDAFQRSANKLKDQISKLDLYFSLIYSYQAYSRESDYTIF